MCIQIPTFRQQKRHLDDFFYTCLVQALFGSLDCVFCVRFSMECRRTKTTVIILANHKGHNLVNQSKLDANTFRATQRAGKSVRACHDCLSLFLIG